MFAFGRSLATSVIIYYFATSTMDGNSILNSKTQGSVTDEWSMSFAIFVSVFLAVTINLIITTKQFTIAHLISIVCMSILPLAIIFAQSNYRKSSWMFNVVAEDVTSPLFYATILLCVSLCSVLDYAIYAI